MGAEGGAKYLFLFVFSSLTLLVVVLDFAEFTNIQYSFVLTFFSDESSQ